MSLRMPLNYFDANEMDGMLDDAIEEGLAGKIGPRRGAGGMKSASEQAEKSSGEWERAPDRL